jgi:thymidine kinase
MQNPSFTVFCGPMFSSKTSRLLMELERCKFQHKSVAVFKPQIDTRYAVGDIVSHSGWRAQAVTVKEGADLLQHILDSDTDYKVIAVDEAFMIHGIAEVLIFLYRSGFSIIVSTLDMAANGKPFPEVTQLLPWATEVIKCTAVCTVCGRDAHYTHKKVTGGDEHTVEVGGDELYEPRCWEHHLLINNKHKMP